MTSCLVVHEPDVRFSFKHDLLQVSDVFCIVFFERTCSAQWVRLAVDDIRVNGIVNVCTGFKIGVRHGNVYVRQHCCVRQYIQFVIGFVPCIIGRSSCRIVTNTVSVYV